MSIQPTESKPNTLIEVRGIERIYKQGEVDVHALRGVDLDIGEGEFTALAGPSGLSLIHI